MYWLGTLGFKEQTSGEFCVLFFAFYISWPGHWRGLKSRMSMGTDKNAPKKAPLSCQRTKKLVALQDKNILITVIPAQFQVNIMSKVTSHPLPNRKWNENY